MNRVIAIAGSRLRGARLSGARLPPERRVLSCQRLDVPDDRSVDDGRVAGADAYECSAANGITGLAMDRAMPMAGRGTGRRSRRRSRFGRRACQARHGARRMTFMEAFGSLRPHETHDSRHQPAAQPPCYRITAKRPIEETTRSVMVRKGSSVRVRQRALADCQRVRVDDRLRPHHAAQRQELVLGEMGLRWTAAGMLEAEKQFRTVIGYTDLPRLRSRWLHLHQPTPTQEATITVSV